MTEDLPESEKHILFFPKIYSFRENFDFIGKNYV